MKTHCRPGWVWQFTPKCRFVDLISAGVWSMVVCAAERLPSTMHLFLLDQRLFPFTLAEVPVRIILFMGTNSLGLVQLQSTYSSCWETLRSTNHTFLFTKMYWGSLLRWSWMYFNLCMTSKRLSYSQTLLAGQLKDGGNIWLDDCGWHWSTLDTWNFKFRCFIFCFQCSVDDSTHICIFYFQFSSEGFEFLYITEDVQISGLIHGVMSQFHAAHRDGRFKLSLCSRASQWRIRSSGEGIQT